MINRESMMDDFYIFNEDRMIFYGRRKKRTFRMGDAVRIRVLRADVDRRQIDFGLVDGSSDADDADLNQKVGTTF
jgi:ribonuclease R